MRTWRILMVAAVVTAMAAAAQWARALFQQREESLAKDRPTTHSIPHGIPDQMAVGYPFKIIQNPALVGYSIGHFDGDALVVETAGFSDVSWLDDPGHPHTEALRVTERFRRKDFGHMEIQITIDDPKAYTKPWTVTENFDFLPDTDLLENICENEKDAVHLVGK